MSVVKKSAADRRRARQNAKNKTPSAAERAVLARVERNRAEQAEADAQAPPADPRHKVNLRALGPITGAFAVVIVVMGVIFALRFFSPASKDADSSKQITQVIEHTYDAVNAQKYRNYSDTTCAKIRSAPTFPKYGAFGEMTQKQIEGKGTVKVHKISQIQISGELASAKVDWTYAKTPTTTHSTTIKLSHEDDAWRVCTPKVGLGG